MTRRLTLVWVLAAYALTAALVGVGLVDDAYIFLRYAANAAAGHGPVFNPGERVEGYTSPLWMAFATVLFWIRGEPSVLLSLAGGAIGFAAVAVVALRRSLAGALVLATSPAFVFWSFSGLETPLTCLTVLVGLVFTFDAAPSRHTQLTAAAAWSAAVLTRPESALLGCGAAVILVLRAWPQIGSAARRLAVFAPAVIVAVAHLFWRHHYYGAWLPNTFAAKAGVGLDVLAASGGLYLLAAAVAFAPLLAIVLVTRAPDRAWIWWLCALWCLSLVALGGDFFPYFRFVVPLLPLLAWAVGDLPGHFRHATLAVAGGIVVANGTMLVGPERAASRWELRQAEAWAESGRMLREQLAPGESIASIVVGAVAYFSERPTIDLVGLTDAHIAHRGHIYRQAMIGHQRFDTDYVLNRRPTAIFLPSSGLFDTPQHQSRGWPGFTSAQLRQAYALASLVDDPRTRTRYVYRVDRLHDGTFLETLRAGSRTP